MFIIKITIAYTFNFSQNFHFFPVPSKITEILHLYRGIFCHANVALQQCQEKLNSPTCINDTNFFSFDYKWQYQIATEFTKDWPFDFSPS